MLLALYYRHLRRGGTRRAPAYGAEETAFWALRTLLRNAGRPAACPSHAFRELAKVTLLQRCAIWVFLWAVTAPLAVLVGTVQRCFARKAARPALDRALRLAVLRPDLVSFAAASGWGSRLSSLYGAARHFSDVDLARLYSIAIRCATHVADINACEAQGRLEDKHHFRALAEKHSISHLAEVRSEEQGRAVLAGGGALFCKPALLQWGEGTFVIDDPADPRLAAAVADPDTVVQERLVNRADLAKYFPPGAPLCTARITTFWTEDGPKVLEAWIRVGATGSTADQFEAGGSSFAVYAETGVVWRGATVAGMRDNSSLEPSQVRAPGAAEGIAGAQLPFWAEAVQLALRAHKAMAPNAFSVGWDVAFGERGIYLMEGNLISMVALHIGMRYGYMALVWPDSCLLWAALAQWTLGKPDGPRGDAAALAARLQSGRREAELLLEHATFQAEELTLQLLAAKQRDPEAQGAEVARLRHELELRQGEQFGLRRELAHLDTLVASYQARARMLASQRGS